MPWVEDKSMQECVRRKQQTKTKSVLLCLGSEQNFEVKEKY